MTLAELKQHIDAFYEMHPLAKVDFTYPVRARGKLYNRLGNVTSMEMCMSPHSERSYLRIRLEYTGANREDADEAGVTP